MPDRRTHHGPHPQDATLFARTAWPRLQSAVADYSWLLTRGYAQLSAVKVVGDRYALDQRQRSAVARGSCSDAALAVRRSKQISPPDAAGRSLRIDGFNVLTTLEVALGGGAILSARDDCYRDLAGVHGTYRKVEETRPAVMLAGQTLARLRPAECIWYLDTPVGNSGRLKRILLETAADQNWNWQVELVPDPDPLLMATDAVVASADSVVLDGCRAWLNLARQVITEFVPDAWIVPLVP